MINSQTLSLVFNFVVKNMKNLFCYWKNKINLVYAYRLDVSCKSLSASEAQAVFGSNFLFSNNKHI